MKIKIVNMWARPPRLNNSIIKLSMISFFVVAPSSCPTDTVYAKKLVHVP